MSRSEPGPSLKPGFNASIGLSFAGIGILIVFDVPKDGSHILALGLQPGDGNVNGAVQLLCRHGSVLSVGVNCLFYLLILLAEEAYKGLVS